MPDSLDNPRPHRHEFKIFPSASKRDNYLTMDQRLALGLSTQPEFRYKAGKLCGCGVGKVHLIILGQNSPRDLGSIDESVTPEFPKSFIVDLEQLAPAAIASVLNADFS